jgi:hypothetical protein
VDISRAGLDDYGKKGKRKRLSVFQIRAARLFTTRNHKDTTMYHKDTTRNLCLFTTRISRGYQEAL